MKSLFLLPIFILLFDIPKNSMAQEYRLHLKDNKTGKLRIIEKDKKTAYWLKGRFLRRHNAVLYEVYPGELVFLNPKSEALKPVRIDSISSIRYNDPVLFRSIGAGMLVGGLLVMTTGFDMLLASIALGTSSKILGGTALFLTGMPVHATGGLMLISGSVRVPLGGRFSLLVLPSE
jgi:hypothetical protein